MEKLWGKKVWCWRYAELTCKQDSELVSRNWNNSGLCGAWRCSLRLQFKLNHWLIHLPQLAGAQSVVDTPGHTVQASHWNSLQSRMDGTLQSVLSQQCHRRQLSSSVTFVFVFEKGRQKYLRLRLVSLSLSCNAECLSSYDLQSPVVCSKRMDACAFVINSQAKMYFK